MSTSCSPRSMCWPRRPTSAPRRSWARCTNMPRRSRRPSDEHPPPAPCRRFGLPGADARRPTSAIPMPSLPAPASVQPCRCPGGSRALHRRRRPGRSCSGPSRATASWAPRACLSSRAKRRGTRRASSACTWRPRRGDAASASNCCVRRWTMPHRATGVKLVQLTVTQGNVGRAGALRALRLRGLRRGAVRGRGGRHFCRRSTCGARSRPGLSSVPSRLHPRRRRRPARQVQRGGRSRRLGQQPAPADTP